MPPIEPSAQEQPESPRQSPGQHWGGPPPWSQHWGTQHGGTQHRGHRQWRPGHWNPEWHANRRLLFLRFLSVFGLIFLFTVGGMALLAYLLTRWFGGDGHTAIVVWLSGCGLAFGLPMVGIALAVLAASCLGKFGACWAAARLSGEDNRTSLALGALMNSRGLMELIIINIGLQKGIIQPALFSVMVLMAKVPAKVIGASDGEGPCR